MVKVDDNYIIINMSWIFGVLCVVNFVCINSAPLLNDDENAGKEYLQALNVRLTEELRKLTTAEWNFASNITDETMEAQVSLQTNLFLQKSCLKI